jgi:hypothetical protein
MTPNFRIVLFATVLGAAGAVLWFGHQSSASASENGESASPTLVTISATPSATPTQSPPAGYLPYSNPQFHFSLDYPSNLQMHTYQEPGSGFTAAFQDPTDNVGFEVYVTPYSGTQISEDRFKLDEPSGVIRQQTDVMIDGVRATMFYGNNAIMGDTREVWFIHGGLLYEVTTYKQLDSWLAQIMQTWQFI